MSSVSQVLPSEYPDAVEEGEAWNIGDYGGLYGGVLLGLWIRIIWEFPKMRGTLFWGP